MFKNREEAGKLLAQALKNIDFDKENTIVLALPRGGVPIAKEIANTLELPLDIFFVKKIPSPYNKEAAIGAVSENGYFFINPQAKALLNISDSYIESALNEVINKIREKRAVYNIKPKSFKGKDIILVDDGVATGSSMKLAVDALKKEGVNKVLIAAPVAPYEVAKELEKIANRAIFLSTPVDFNAVGEFYEDFHQLSDEEVVKLLNS
ncbi:MAG: phosphoribosyltransferase [Epsilonproteobacteria bacterium]|nr:phosphoribosyltransferase [Campylobacterota bacterium]